MILSTIYLINKYEYINSIQIATMQDQGEVGGEVGGEVRERCGRGEERRGTERGKGMLFSSPASYLTMDCMTCIKEYRNSIYTQSQWLDER